MKNFKDYIVENKYIIQNKKPHYNAIDSNFLTTNTYYLQSLHGEHDWDVSKTILNFSNDGRILRFPHSVSGIDSKESEHWDDSRTVSRDNSIGCLVALSSMCGGEGITECRKFAWLTFKRLSFFQNTHTVKMEKKLIPDFCDPGSWAIILRATMLFNNILFWPLFLILDCFYTVNVLTFLIKNKYFDNDYNSPLYHMISSVYFMNNNQRSPITMLNKWLLLTKCPENKKFPRSAYINLSAVGSQLMEYSRSSYDPPIHDIYERLRVLL